MSTVQKGLTISVIEHDEAAGSVLETLLEEEGYTVELSIFPVDETAIANPDLLIFDVSPYQMDKEISLLASLCQGLRMPIILISTSRVLMNKAIGDCEVVAELEKPFDLNKLLELVKSSLN